MNRRTFLAILGTGILGTACAAPASSPTAAPTAAKPASPPAKKPAATTAPAKPTAAAKPAATAAPAKPKDVIKLKIVQSSPGLSFAPVYLANARNLWGEEGLDVEWSLVQNGAVATTAVINDEAQFMATASSDPIAGSEKNLSLFGVAGITTSLTMSVGARKDWMQGKGVTAQSPLKDRVTALKGSRVGVSSVAGAPTQFGKYLIKSQGLNPESDVDFLVVGGGASRIAALRQNQVDTFIGGTPDAEVAEFEGFGAVFINMAKDFPIFQNFIYEVLTGTKDYAEKNPEAVRRAARAIARANNLIQSDLAGSIASLRQSMPEINPQVVELAMNNAQKAFGKDALMTEAMWKNAIDVLVDGGTVKRAPKSAEGELWTNKFLK